MAQKRWTGYGPDTLIGRRGPKALDRLRRRHLDRAPWPEWERWVPWVREAEALLVAGGDATYLCHWMRESGLVELMASLPDTVWGE